MICSSFVFCTRVKFMIFATVPLLSEVTNRYYWIPNRMMTHQRKESWFFSCTDVCFDGILHLNIIAVTVKSVLPISPEVTVFFPWAALSSAFNWCRRWIYDIFLSASNAYKYTRSPQSVSFHFPISKDIQCCEHFSFYFRQSALPVAHIIGKFHLPSFSAIHIS